MTGDAPPWRPHYDAMLSKRSGYRHKVTCWNDEMESIELENNSGECTRSDYPHQAYSEAAGKYNQNKLRRVYAHDNFPDRSQKMRKQTDVLRDKRNVAVERIRLGEHRHSVFEKGLTVLGVIYYVMTALVVVRLGYMLHDSGGGLLDPRNRGLLVGLLAGGLFFCALPFVTQHAIRGSYAWWTRDVPEGRKTLGLKPEVHPTASAFEGASNEQAGGRDYIPNEYIEAQREAAENAIATEDMGQA